MIKTTDSCSFREIEVDDSDLPSVDYLTYRNLCIKQLILKRELTYDQIGAQFFPPLTGGCIYEVARSFGIRQKERNHLWTDKEKESLKTDWTKMTKRELVEKYKISHCSVKYMANELGLSRRPNRLSLHNAWTKEEDEFLIKNKDKSMGYLRKHLNRSTYGVRHELSALGLKRER